MRKQINSLGKSQIEVYILVWTLLKGELECAGFVIITGHSTLKLIALEMKFLYFFSGFYYEVSNSTASGCEVCNRVRVC